MAQVSHAARPADFISAPMPMIRVSDLRKIMMKLGVRRTTDPASPSRRKICGCPSSTGQSTIPGLNGMETCNPLSAACFSKYWQAKLASDSTAAEPPPPMRMYP